MPDDEFALQAYSKIAEQISKEDALINQRMTWGISINAGLLVLLGFGYGLLKDIFTQASARMIASLALAILAAGAVLVYYNTIRAVRDARMQIFHIRHIYETKWKQRIEDKIGLPRPFGSRELYTEEEGRTAKSSWWAENLFFIVGSVWLIIVLTSLVIAVRAGIALIIGG